MTRCCSLMWKSALQRQRRWLTPISTSSEMLRRRQKRNSPMMILWNTKSFRQMSGEVRCLSLKFLSNTGLSYLSLFPVHMLSKAAIACWCLNDRLPCLALAFMHSAKISPALQTFFASLLCLSVPACTCHILSTEYLLSAHTTFKLSFVSSKITHSWLFCSVFQEHIYKEILSFSPIARKDSKKRSGMSL